MSLSRRYFLKNSAAFAVGFAGLHSLVGPAAASLVRDPGFGPLVPDPEGVLDLPDGFSYRIISTAGERMDDGLFVPGAPDGMAAFPGDDGQTIVVRNHEVNAAAPESSGPFGANNELLAEGLRDRLYDGGGEGSPCLGGTTTFVYDTRAQEVVSQHLSLSGTVRNCAGGPTPWGSWITCEESTLIAGQGVMLDHGYNFEVPASADGGLVEAVALKEMGRFNHEAVAVHPESGIVYQTEDRGDGLLYRYISNEPGRLSEGGRLQALAVVDRPSLDTRNWEQQTVEPGQSMDVEWIDLEDAEAPDDDLRLRGFEAGAARFARGEGMWYGRGAVFFACTNGGRRRAGQVWRYVPGRNEETEPGRLELFIEPNDTNLVENCDNVTVTPWGDLILCEDGPGDTYLVGVTPAGRLYRFGRNALSTSEFAGATFSPDGTTLFFNIQGDGLTVAITGPWKRPQG